MKAVDINTKLTIERLKQLLQYTPEDGRLIWKEKPSPSAPMRIGDEAGSDNKNGYRRVWIDGERFLNHRLVWLYMTSAWPTEMIDHIDGDKANNRWANLRPATNSENKANGKTYRKQSSLPKGVAFRHGKYVGQIVHNYKHYHLGCFDNPNEAHLAYLAAAERLHGEFAKAG